MLAFGSIDRRLSDMSGCKDYPGYRGCPSAYPGFWTLVRGLPDDANCYFEALDVDDARFRPLPMALTATYMKPVAREFRVAYTRDLSDSSKPDWLLAAWGAWNANQYWSLDEKLAFLKSTAAVEVNTGLLMAHETHRSKVTPIPNP